MSKALFLAKFLTLFGVSLAWILGPAAYASNKADLVDAISAGAKLTKADAGRALDATLNAINTTLLPDSGVSGLPIALDGFGIFSVTDQVIAQGGACVPVGTPVFEASVPLIKIINTIPMDKGLRFRVISVESTPVGVVATGLLQQGSVYVGDMLALPATPGTASPFYAEVVGVTVGGVATVEANKGQIAGLSLRGIEKKDVKRGLMLVRSQAVDIPEPPLNPCIDYVQDNEIAAQAAKAAGFTPDTARLVLEVFKDSITSTLAAGESLYIAGFGTFYVIEEQVVSLPEPGTDLSCVRKKGAKYMAERIKD